jgi:hypothetical protein
MMISSYGQVFGHEEVLRKSGHFIVAEALEPVRMPRRGHRRHINS